MKTSNDILKGPLLSFALKLIPLYSSNDEDKNVFKIYNSLSEEQKKIIVLQLKKIIELNTIKNTYFIQDFNINIYNSLKHLNKHTFVTTEGKYEIENVLEFQIPLMNMLNLYFIYSMNNQRNKIVQILSELYDIYYYNENQTIEENIKKKDYFKNNEYMLPGYTICGSNVLLHELIFEIMKKYKHLSHHYFEKDNDHNIVNLLFYKDQDIITIPILQSKDKYLYEIIYCNTDSNIDYHNLILNENTQEDNIVTDVYNQIYLIDSVQKTITVYNDDEFIKKIFDINNYLINIKNILTKIYYNIFENCDNIELIIILCLGLSKYLFQ